MMENIASSDFCLSLTHYERLKTRQVYIGEIPLGGENPIRVQSMTTSDTMDTERVVAEIIRLYEVGAEYVRLTAPSIKEAEHLAVIKDVLAQKNIYIPLIADIHFTPNAAEVAARIVEKVRINPGNFVDKKKFQTLEYSDEEYQAELERIRQKFTPLVQLCKERNIAMRIGANHGSLSDRIMSRYGDTPLGMVESAMEFLRIARDLDYHNIVISMKASNPGVMVRAYRLLSHTMLQHGMNYPLHLGVTEAGDGEDGRIKSAVGIGTLLEDGLGDTIRVSLTEDSEHEIPVAKKLVERYHHRQNHALIPAMPEGFVLNLLESRKRKSIAIASVGGENVPRVLINCSAVPITAHEQLKPFGHSYLPALDKWGLSEAAADMLYIGSQPLPTVELHPNLVLIRDVAVWQADVANTLPLLNITELESAKLSKEQIFLIRLTLHDILKPETRTLLEQHPQAILVFFTQNSHAMAELRRAFVELEYHNLSHPVIIEREYTGISDDAKVLYAATDIGALLLDGWGDGVFLTFDTPDLVQAQALANRTAFGILQATRTRISKTEYIACPSCGRTLFDLQETTAKIRSRTSHLVGVKIGIMGCIVNGPGEMADADFGYVGSGPGKITLYKGKDIVKKNINSEFAVDELIHLIKEHGMWKEPASAESE